MGIINSTVRPTENSSPDGGRSAWHLGPGAMRTVRVGGAVNDLRRPEASDGRTSDGGGG